MNLGEIVKNARISAGLTLQDVAKHTGLSIGYLSEIENGKSLRPKMKALRDIAGFLCINQDDIIMAAQRIPEDVYWKVVRTPSLVAIIRSYEA